MKLEIKWKSIYTMQIVYFENHATRRKSKVRTSEWHFYLIF